MAYQDTLFQLGMDLTRSSTAQKEDHGETARVARSPASVQSLHADRASASINRSESRVSGQRIVIELVGGSRFKETAGLETALKSAVELAGGSPLKVRFDRQVPGGGISGEIALARGRITFRSGMQPGLTTVQLEGCDGIRPERAMMALSHELGAREALIKRQFASPVNGPSLSSSMSRSPAVADKGTKAARVARVRAA